MLMTKKILGGLLTFILIITLIACSNDMDNSKQEPIPTSTYTITWEVNGLIVEIDKNVEEGSIPSYDGENPAKTDEQFEYTFSGWTPEITPVTQNQTYTAVFFTGDIKEYIITWLDVDDSVLGVTTVPYGIVPVFNLPEDSEQWKYTGWTPEVIETEGNATYKAERELQEYTITWRNDDGSIISTSSAEFGSIPVFEGTESLQSSTGNKDYMFYAWTPELESVTENKEYYAQYYYELVLNNRNFSDYFNFYEESDEGGSVTGEGFRMSIRHGRFQEILEFKSVYVSIKLNFSYFFEYRPSGIVDYGTSSDIQNILLDGANPNSNWDYSYTISAGPSTYIRSLNIHFSGVDQISGSIIVLALPYEEFTVNYELYGGINDFDNPEIFSPLNDNITLNSPNKEGYTFLGWYDNPEYTGGRITEISSGTSNNLTLFAKWTINQYTVTFTSNGGSDVNDIVQGYPAVLLEPEQPTKNGYTFAGWYIDQQLSQPYIFNSIPSENITLFAKWTINQYTITFDSSGGPEVNSITQDYGSMITEPAEPISNGYTFYNWFTEKELINIYKFSTMPAENITLYAGWIINQYTITFDSNGGIEVDSITQDYASVIAEPVPTKEGYTFDGWYTDETLNERFIFSKMPAENITLYAKWEANIYSVILHETTTDDAKFTVYFNSMGGSSINPQIVSKEVGLYIPDIPIRDNYHFNGWYDNDGNLFDFSKNISEDKELFASWILKQNTTSSKSVDMFGSSAFTGVFGYSNSDLKIFFTPILTGNTIIHLFNSSGSYTVKLYNQSSNELIDSWTVSKYSSSNDYSFMATAGSSYFLTFRTISSDDVSYASCKITGTYFPEGGLAADTTQSIEYNSFFVLDIPEKEGYTFNGWYDEINGTGIQYTDMYGVSTRPWDKLSDTILYPSWIEYNGISQIDINDFNNYFNFNMYTSIPAIFSNDYVITYDQYDDGHIVSIAIFEWSLDDALFYNNLLDTIFEYNETEIAWKNGDYYIHTYYDDISYDHIVYGISFYIYY